MHACVSPSLSAEPQKVPFPAGVAIAKAVLGCVGANLDEVVESCHFVALTSKAIT